MNKNEINISYNEGLATQINEPELQEPKKKKRGQQSLIVAKRRALVHELWEAGNKAKEIAQDLETSIVTVNNDLARLRRQGITVSDRFREPTPQNSKRRELVKELLLEGKSAKQIAEIASISEITVYNDTVALKKQGTTFEKKNQSPAITKRREKVRELWNEGKNGHEISAIINEPQGKVYRDIAVLRNQGVMLEKRKGAIRASGHVTKRRIVAQRLWNEGKSAIEIASITGETVGKVYNDISFLRKRGENLARRRYYDTTSTKSNSDIQIDEQAIIAPSKEEIVIFSAKKTKQKKQVEAIMTRRKKVQELWNQGKTRKEIAKEIYFSLSVIQSDIIFLKQQGEELR